MCSRLERPGSPTDIFLLPAPTEAELAAVKHLVECTLAGVPQEDMPPPPTRLPDLPVAAAPPPPAAAPVAPGMGKAGAAGAKAAPLVQAAAGGVGKQQPQAAQQAAQQGQVAGLDWRSLSTWARLAAVLDAGDGFEGQDVYFAAWLLEHLAKRNARKSVL